MSLLFVNAKKTIDLVWRNS